MCVLSVVCAVMLRLTCVATLQAMPGKMEAELANGLIMGHAYSVTAVKLVRLYKRNLPHVSSICFKSESQNRPLCICSDCVNSHCYLHQPVRAWRPHRCCHSKALMGRTI